MRKKKRISLDEALLKSQNLSKKDIYATKYAQSIQNAKYSENDKKLIEKLGLQGGQKGKGKYSLRSAIKNHRWVKEGRPASKATAWLFRDVFKDPKTYKYAKHILYQGGLFIYEYKNPKYKNDLKKLPWFDQYPLVLSLGPTVTNEGVRNIGFNLHLLPPKIRIIVICNIFELHKTMYRYQIFYKKDNPVMVDYRAIVKQLERFGVKFAVRMYIPARQNQIVCFPYKTWANAIFIPSRGYSRIRATKLIQAWRDYCKKQGFQISPNINWKMNI